MISEYLSIGEWKLRVSISIKFISSQNPDQFSIRYSYSENIDINDAVNNLLIF